MKSADTCFYCEQNAADGYCRQCGEPVCVDCCVGMTLHNQIDYTLCLSCHETNQMEMADEFQKSCAAKEKEKKRRDEINKRRRAAYWKPEAVEKRRLGKIRRRKERIRQERKMAEAIVKSLNNMFSGIR